MNGFQISDFKLQILDLATRKSAILASAAVGTFNYLATDFLTRDKIIAAIIAALSVPAAAYFAARPRMKAEERTDFNTLLEQMTRLHATEMAIKDRRIDEKDIEIKLLRGSKHNALGALQAARFHIDNLEDRMRETGVTFPRYNQPAMHEITGDEDKQTMQLVEAASQRIAVLAATEEANKS